MSFFSNLWGGNRPLKTVTDDEIMDKVDLETVERLIEEFEIGKPKKYSSEQLRTFTSNLSHSLGSGAFGTVYKGILHNGVQVAVKVLARGIWSDRIKDQFMAEVFTLGKTHHKNLVKLYGFCLAPDMKALVYELMENGSLDKILYQNETITWEALCDIAIGIANGLSYLHKDCDPKVIHYDIKPSNILLDSNFCPKIGDFGLAKLLTPDKSHVTMSGFRGTRSYGAPELYVKSPSATSKCDVYSYGVLLFDILGRRKLDECRNSFPDQVWEKFQKGQLEECMQSCGIEEKNIGMAKRIAVIALWCVQYMPRDRPSMHDVVRLLEGREAVVAPPDPFGLLNSSISSSCCVTAPNPEVEKKEKVRNGIARKLKVLGPWGNRQSTRWNWDDGAFSTIKQIRLQVTNKEIGSIQIEYCGKNGESIVSKWYGDFNHVIDKIELDYPDEFLTRMTGFHSFRDSEYISDHTITSLCFFSNRRMYGPFGYEVGTYFDSGTYGKIVGFHGCETHLLDAIGLHVEN